MTKNPMELDPVFASALRGELIQFVGVHKRRRRLTPWFATVSAIVVLAGGGVATAAILSLPGAPTLVPVAGSVTVNGTGPRDADLGPAPSDTNYVNVRFECLTAGAFQISGNRITCGEVDVAQESTFDVPLNAVKEGQLTVEAGSSDAWQLTATYVIKSSTEWGRNSYGQTFGVVNDTGTPDLIAVEATNGEQGYVRAVELGRANGDPEALQFTSPDDALRWQQEVAGTTLTLDVFESDGETRIGDFQIQR